MKHSSTCLLSRRDHWEKDECTCGGIKETWEMTRDEYTSVEKVNAIVAKMDLPPAPPSEYAALKAFSNRCNRFPYDPSALTDDAIQRLKDLDLLTKVPKHPKITPTGHTRLIAWVRMQHTRDCKEGNLFSIEMDRLCDEWALSVYHAKQQGKPVCPEVLGDYHPNEVDGLV